MKIESGGKTPANAFRMGLRRATQCIALGLLLAVAFDNRSVAGTAVLQIDIVGSGAVAPNLNSAALNIGSNYSITATPSANYAFSNWIGCIGSKLVIDTNKAALHFVMASNLVLTATFVNTQVPVCSVSLPLPNQNCTNLVFAISGKASGNVRISRVFYKLNTSDWQAAQTTDQWTNWNAGVFLAPGTNLLQTYAVDSTGNSSALSHVTFTAGTNAIDRYCAATITWFDLNPELLT
jgi:hypothetical protein